MFKSFEQYVTEALDDIRLTLAQHTEVLNQLLQQGDEVKADLTTLTAQVAQNVTVEGSAITLIQGIAAQLAAAIAANDPAALDALQAELAASDTSLAAAITANTPAAPTPTPAPAPAPAGA
jgi:hypothetical protein